MEGVCRRLLFFVLILGAFLISQTVFAEEKTGERTEQKDQKKTVQEKDQKSPHKLEGITVTGKKTKEPVTSPYAVTESSQLQTDVWTREEIEALNPETVWDVLRQVPGMEVTFQGRQHMDFSSIRGSGSYGIIMDGVYVSQSDRILSTLPVDAIESMTIVRDATALTLGPLTSFGSGTGSSNQGFVVIKTKRASKLEGGLVTSYGSFHTEKEHLYQGAKIGNFDYRIAGTYNNTLGKTNWYNASRNESLLFRGGYTRPSVEFDIFYYASRGMREFQRSETVVPTLKAGKYDWSQVGQLSTSKWKTDPLISNMFAANLSKHWNDKHTTTFNYAYNSYIVTSMTTDFPDGGKQKVSFADQDSRGQTLSVRHAITSHNNVLKLGGQWLDSVAPNGSAPTTDKRTIDQDMFGLYVQDEYHMFNDRLTIDAGIRGDKKHDSNSPVTYKPVDEWSRPLYAYTVGTAFKLIPMITLTGRYAYTENAQSGNQLTTNGSSLPTEKRSRYEGGVIANIHPSFNPWLTVYYYDTKNQKSPTGTSFIDTATGDEIDYVTATDMQTKGAEVGVSGQILKPLTYRLQYTYVNTNDNSTNKSTPHHRTSGTLSYKYKNFEANTSFRYVSAYSQTQWDQRGGYTMWDGNVGYNCKIFDRDTKITFYVRNIGDKAYLTSGNGDYYNPGRQYGMQLSYSFF
ncbi:MAG: hypothetical protein C0399_08520 [Syntrophus sp. (in: bacteria)]|nr:hypothetical protein [Syntrophus sp. (in: bacteria)]